MINNLLVIGTAIAFEEVLKERSIPYELVDDDETRGFKAIWESADDKDKQLVYRQALPAVRRIAEHEPYLLRQKEIRYVSDSTIWSVNSTKTLSESSCLKGLTSTGIFPFLLKMMPGLFRHSLLQTAPEI